MKAKNFGYRSTVVILVLFIVLSTILAAKGDIGGGPGDAITPYVPDKGITVQQIVIIKNSSNGARKVADLKLKGTHVTQYGEKVGLMYVVDQNVIGEPSFKFRGVSESGDNGTTDIDFSEVRSFTLLRIDKRLFRRDRALLEIVKFPNILPEDLLSQKPSYSELLEGDYTQRVRLWVILESERNGELCLVGKKLYERDQYQVLARLRDIEPNSEVILGYGDARVEGIANPVPTIWWATHSVIEDERYPYRRYFER